MVVVCWGEATWTRTQLIEQLAKGSFAMAMFKASDIFNVAEEPDAPAVDDLFMSIHNSNRAIAPGENEMSRAVVDAQQEQQPFEDNEQAREHRRKLREQLLANNRPPVGRPQNRARISTQQKP